MANRHGCYGPDAPGSSTFAVAIVEEAEGREVVQVACEGLPYEWVKALGEEWCCPMVLLSEEEMSRG